MGLRLEQLVVMAVAAFRVDLCSRIMGEDNSKEKGSEAEKSVSQADAACSGDVLAALASQ